jgi:hypothetical protein
LRESLAEDDAAMAGQGRARCVCVYECEKMKNECVMMMLGRERGRGEDWGEGKY